MDYKIDDHGQAMTVYLTGAWAFHDHESFRTMLRTMRTSDAVTFEINCEELEEMEAAGLGMLSMVHDMATTKGADLKLAAVQGAVSDFLTTAKFDRLVPMETV